MYINLRKNISTWVNFHELLFYLSNTLILDFFFVLLNKQKFRIFFNSIFYGLNQIKDSLYNSRTNHCENPRFSFHNRRESAFSAISTLKGDLLKKQWGLLSLERTVIENSIPSWGFSPSDSKCNQNCGENV